MKSIILGIALSLLSLPALASDSIWLLCDNGKLALNLLEHRSANGTGRVTSLNLLLGMNIFSGQLNNTDSGKVYLTSTNGNNGHFKGNVSVNYPQETVYLQGTLYLTDSNLKINSKLHCKRKN